MSKRLKLESPVSSTTFDDDDDAMSDTSSTPTTPKPGVQKHPEAVKRRNARERRRVHQVNLAFVKLRDHIPQPSRAKKLSKVDTLRGAAEYITLLQNVLHSPEIPFNYSPVDNGQMPYSQAPSGSGYPYPCLFGTPPYLNQEVHCQILTNNNNILMTNFADQSYDATSSCLDESGSSFGAPEPTPRTSLGFCPPTSNNFINSLQFPIGNDFPSINSVGY